MKLLALLPLALIGSTLFMRVEPVYQPIKAGLETQRHCVSTCGSRFEACQEAFAMCATEHNSCDARCVLIYGTRRKPTHEEHEAMHRYAEAFNPKIGVQ